MRITNNMMSQSILSNLHSAQGNIYQLQNQLSSGLKISKPSDDPASVQNILRMNNNTSSVTQWTKASTDAVNYMTSEDSAMGSISDMLQKVNELALEGANGTMSQDDRAGVADEVDQINTQMQMVANTKVGTNYIFSGTATDKELIPSSGASEANGNPVLFQVGDNVSIDVSVNGQTLYGDSTTGIVATLNSLSAHLRDTTSTSDVVTDNINNDIANINSNLDNVVDMRADLGARTNRMTAVGSQLDSTATNLQQNLSTLEDTDMAKAITDLTNQQNTYQAALSVGAKIIQPSLVDYISST